MIRPIVVKKARNLILDGLSDLDKCGASLSKIHGELRAAEEAIGYSADLRGYRTEHFRLEELVPETLYNIEKERCWLWLSPQLLWTLDAIRDALDTSIYVNGWFWGHETRMRGLRPFDAPVGSAMSLHKFGSAYDINAEGMSVDALEEFILNEENKNVTQFISRIRKYSTHLHIDSGNCYSDSITIMK